MKIYESYSRPIDIAHKCCVLFLIDQSYSMDEPLGNSPVRKCDQFAKAINRWLETVVIINSNGEGEYEDRMDVGVIGYRTDSDGNPIIERALSEPLAEKDLVTVAELAASAEYVTMRKTIASANSLSNNGVTNRTQAP